MNEFFLASNRAIKTTFLDMSVDVRQIQVKELDQIASVADSIKISLDNSFDNIDTALSGNLIECLTFASIICQIPNDVLTKAFLEQHSETKALIELCLKVNRPYFIESAEDIKKRKRAEAKEKRGGSTKNTEDHTLFDTFQFLISMGHRHDEIMNMSYGAFREYIKAAQRAFASGLITDANVIRVANHGDKKGFSKFVDDLKEQ